MNYLISEIAKLTGVSVRTLHYYDQIGLLTPVETSEAGYRYYNEENLETLQQILFFRELDFSLKEMMQIMYSPNYNKEEALRKQKELLFLKKRRLEKLIELINNNLRGDGKMDFSKFDVAEIESLKKEYAKEAKERWGETKAYEESLKRTEQYQKEDWNRIMSEMNYLIEAFAQCRNQLPGDKKVQELVEQWKSMITKNYYECTDEILAGLGIMYQEDERFKKNMDRHGEGTAKFMRDAITFYCQNNKTEHLNL